ncbi:hypothetical protein ACHAW5_005263 [Stephanodiscus triporus]|uniref:Plastid lipid-associated protein/fibrillin conserved domain-containing protein n=1 Tax=Stephanodiscus triporus TaxID=2934178 RepID=A0ABD3P8U1_9STRA
MTVLFLHLLPQWMMMHAAQAKEMQHHNAAMSIRRMLIIVAFCLQPSSTDAFQSNPALLLRRPPLLLSQHRPAVTLSRCSRQSQCCRNACPDDSALDGGRRIILSRFSFMITTGVVLTNPLIVPPLAFADDEEEDEDAASKATLDKVESLMKDEIDLNADVAREEQDEKKLIEDQRQLIDELEKEIQVIEESDDLSNPKKVEEEADKVKDVTEALIKEEEKLKSETEEVIIKIEAMESEVQSLDGAGMKKTHDGDDEDAIKKKASESFVEKLKESVEQKEDLITRLKRQSERDVDPKTGKFKSMTPSEYKQRVKSTDVDIIQFLKDTVANEQELKNDLNAFEGFLDKEIGPIVRELKKDLMPIVGEAKKDVGPLVGEIESQLRKEVAPAVGDAMQQLKENAKSVVEGELEDLKQGAVDLIGKLRSVF